MDSTSVISFLIIVFLNLAYTQDKDINAGSYEIREHSLNRPYPAGMFCIF
jgi:hypothetical protein